VLPEPSQITPLLEREKERQKEQKKEKDVSMAC
jgi:hypothetical protein